MLMKVVLERTSGYSFRLVIRDGAVINICLEQNATF